MGFNTSMIIMNDALNDIREDKDFGKNLYRACMRTQIEAPVDVPAGNHVNAATVIESHHADNNVVLIVGGNRAIDTGASVYCSGYIEDGNLQLAALKSFADKLGYRVVRKNRVRK